MKLGTYNSKHGIYEFDGKHYKPRWFANLLRMEIPVVYATCITGYDAPKPEPAKWPKAILVAVSKVTVPSFDKSKTVEGLLEHYPGIYAQSQLHAYAPGTPGKLPNWCKPWEGNASMLIHEYTDGHIAWLRPNFDNDVYLFFTDTAAPPVDDDPGNGGVVIPGIPKVITVNLHVWRHNVDD